MPFFKWEFNQLDPYVFRAGFFSGLRGRMRIYHTILKMADHALFKMVRYVFLRPPHGKKQRFLNLSIKGKVARVHY
jgi:hypothetical protein